MNMQKKSLFVKTNSIYVVTIGRLFEVIEKGYLDMKLCQCLLIDEADKFKIT